MNPVEQLQGSSINKKSASGATRKKRCCSRTSTLLAHSPTLENNVLEVHEFFCPGVSLQKRVISDIITLLHEKSE
jgi:hypothetical protein